MKKQCWVCIHPRRELIESEWDQGKRGVSLMKKYVADEDFATASPRKIEQHFERYHHSRGAVAPLIDLPPIPAVEAPAAPQAPKGWEPGVKWERATKDGAPEQVFTLPIQEQPLGGPEDWLKVMEECGFPVPKGMKPVLKEFKWHSALWHRDVADKGEPHTAYTAPGYGYKVAFVIDETVDWDEELKKLVADIRSCKAEKPPVITAVGETLVVGLADWQLGKRDKGGTEAVAARLVRLGPQIVARVHELQRFGRNVERLVLVGLGDLVEGCVGFYPSQTFGVELDDRQQKRAARRLLKAIIEDVATLGIPVIVTGVAGNHGEKRANGKAFTNTGDNTDLEVFEGIAEVFEGRRDYAHVSFVVPNQERYHELDCSGATVLFSHGHLGTSGGAAGIWRWFKDLRAHDKVSAKILWVGHYHHLLLEVDGVLTLLQCTAGEDGSEWFEETRGSVTKPGTTTALVSSAYGVRDLAVLG